MFMLLNYTNIKQMVIHDRRPKELFSNSDESGSKLNYVWFPNYGRYRGIHKPCGHGRRRELVKCPYYYISLI